MKRGLLVALVVCQLVAASAVAAPQTSAELFRLGQERFQSGQVEAAIEAFARGYQLDPRPEFLLNLAQSYRALGRRPDAIAHLRRFIEQAPTHPLRPQAERTLAELERAEREAPTIPTPREVAASRPTAAAPLTPPAPPPARKARLWPWIAGGAVVAVAATVAIVLLTRPAGDEPVDTIVVPGP